MTARDPQARRVQRFGTTVFSEFSALAAAHRAVNLGQGFPDFDGPEEIREAAVKAIRDGVNQYAVGAGAPVLREALAEHAARFHGQRLDPASEVTVTSGATEAILDAMLGCVDPGDEVILFEPFYDSYTANVEFVGGVPRFVLLRPPDSGHPEWWFDPEELRAAFSARTRLLVLNTPHNPTGKVFRRDELELIAELCQRHDALVLADEVYEHIVYAPARHLRIATLPGMAERTLTVGSAGKTFSLTGWKIGWILGSRKLRGAAQAAHQFNTFASASPLQPAVAHGLRMPDAFFTRLAAEYQQRRDTLVAVLREVGLTPQVPEGSYFILADIRGWGFSDDWEFCRTLTREHGVAAIPPTAFYGDEHRASGRQLARFAFCKKTETLQAAADRLRARRG